MLHFKENPKGVKLGKKTFRQTPLERHSTAAWANRAARKDISQVPLPSALDVELAREWVNQNQK
ncbi:MAG: DUF3787 domain-containing protein [Firmicutes bacterium]|nr:DUF3787 domain-containing protein [Bacillota bacterium]